MAGQRCVDFRTRSRRNCEKTFVPWGSESLHEHAGTRLETVSPPTTLEDRSPFGGHRPSVCYPTGLDFAQWNGAGSNNRVPSERRRGLPSPRRLPTTDEVLSIVRPVTLDHGLMDRWRGSMNEDTAYAITLHSIFTEGMLYLWGSRRAEDDVDAPSRFMISNPATASDAAGRDHFDNWHPARAISASTLRRIAGDVYDGLLVSGSTDAELTLRLPSRGPSESIDETSDEQRPEPSDDASPLRTTTVPALAFGAADAIDLLTSDSAAGGADIAFGDSIRFWSRAADLVLELLANQRFVPSIHHGAGERFLAYWRVVVDDKETSVRLGKLIASMPPICRALPTSDTPIQASTLTENFLWTSVDALVRRCMDGDELTHAIHDRNDEHCSPQMLWLRSLVGPHPTLSGEPDEQQRTLETVRGWLTKLEPSIKDRTSRTCVQLHAPDGDAEDSRRGRQRGWRLTLHVQAVEDESLIIDAEKLFDPGADDDPRILKRPFDNAAAELRQAVGVAARRFPPLAPCAEPDGPVSVPLSLEEAYTFLRDVTPILEMEGFGVWVPRWWRNDQPKLRLWLDVRPIAGSSSTATSGMGLDALVEYDWRVAVGNDEMTAEELLELSSAKDPLVKIRNRWTEVHAPDVAAALAFLKRQRSGTMTVFEALRQSYVADDLNTGIAVGGLRTHGWVSKLLDATNACESIEHLVPPKHFVGELRPYQLRGLEWLGFLKHVGIGGCLADDMGLGKTIQLIALWLYERESDQPVGPTLLVVPMSLVGNWNREIERFGPSLRTMIHHGAERLSGDEFVREVSRHDVVISTYGLIHRDWKHLDEVSWFRIALDEAQNIKNPAAKQSIAVRSLRAVHKLALTGTPVENRLSELWSIMEFLNTGYIGTAADFRRRFAVPIERHHDADRATRLRQLIRPFILRRLKSDPTIEVDLPAKMEMKVFCNLTEEQAALYKTVVDGMLGAIDEAGGIQRRGLILAALVRLKQICNHPAQYLADGSSLPHRSGKCDRLTEMLEEVIAEGDQAIIFTQFRQMGALLQPLLQDTLGCGVQFLHGGTNRKARDAMVERFQTEGDAMPLFILSLKAGGYGLNLTAASHVFHFDRWWNPAVEDQATDRAHRIGQTKRVQVHKFVSIGTLEERIDALLETKRSLADHVVGGGEEWLTELSTDKLREVFELSREAVAER